MRAISTCDKWPIVTKLRKKSKSENSLSKCFSPNQWCTYKCDELSSRTSKDGNSSSFRWDKILTKTQILTNKSIPKEFSKSSQWIPKEFPKDSQKVQKKFSLNSPQYPPKIPIFWKYPIPYIALRGQKHFQACSPIKSNLILPDNLTLQVKLSTFITLMTKTRTRQQLSTKNQTMLSWSTFICILPCYFYSWIKLFIYHLLQKNIKDEWKS